MATRRKRHRKPRAAGPPLQEALHQLRAAINLVLRAQASESRTPPPEVWKLTTREGEVLQAVLEGEDTLNTVAGELHISPRTFRGHLRKIQEKLRVRSLRGLIKAAVKAGWG